MVMMSRSDAASNQECSAFATNYKHITTPIMVVQVTFLIIIIITFTTSSMVVKVTLKNIVSINASYQL